MQEQNKLSEYGHFVQVNDINQYYLDCGKGYPVVLLHGGIGTSAFTWGNYIPILSQHFRLIVPDCRGRGKTNNPLQRLSYQLLVQDTIALCEILNINKPIFCGWSDGGQIALEIAAKHSGFAKGIVAAGVISEMTDNYVKNTMELGISAPGKVDYDAIQEKIPYIIAQMKLLHSFTKDPDYWKTLYLQLSHLWLTSDEFLGNRIRNISIPTLLVIGDRDNLIPYKENFAMFDSIPNVEMCVLPNTAHDVSSPRVVQLFSNVIIDFITRISDEFMLRNNNSI